MSATAAMESTGTTRAWTDEQQQAIDRREGDLLLAAGAGSGKTSVLVERFVRAVCEDGLGVGEILTITFTEKAAAEMRERIRVRLQELGAHEAAVATEGAFISTIHGFCARVLRTHALTAGLDPAFVVLDEHEASELADAAFAASLAELAEGDADVVELIASHGTATLRAGLLGVHDELRSRGAAVALPPIPPPAELEGPRAAFGQAAAAVSAELAAVAQPGVKVLEALDRLARRDELLEAAVPWPGELDLLCLPGGNGAALSTPACEAYSAALATLRAACEQHHAARAHRVLDRLLQAFAARYGELKRARSAVDFEDLELMTRALLSENAAVRERYWARFRRLMVDELQDTNRVQLELIGALADGNLFTVGDAQQSIYGFRHADVALFEQLAAERRAQGRYATLQVNFRSRPEILRVVNATFARELGERFTPLVAGRTDPPAADPRVELLVVDKGAEFRSDELTSPWRLAEARVLAARVRALLDHGTPAREVVILTRATTDLRTYERVLEAHGVPTYLIGGRGYWGHPQVLDLLAYLRALANPLDEEALYTLLACPLVDASLDALVLLGAAAKADGAGVWPRLRGDAAWAEGLPVQELARLQEFADWFAGERARTAHLGAAELIDRVLERTGYDMRVLGQRDGRRRLANIRKLMRLAHEHEATHGVDLRGFLELCARRGAAGAGSRESEAPVEGEALDAVRLMTIHRSKGLEFETVCVADLGRLRRSQWELIRVGADGRVGLRLSRPGSGRALPALAYGELGEARMRAEEAEERRLFYVAMTRARERLVLSGAAKLDGWPDGNGGTAIGWLAAALIPDFGQRIDGGAGVTEEGVAYTIVREPPPDPGGPSEARAAPAATAPPPAVAPERAHTRGGGDAASARVRTLSYTTLSEHLRCGYRFYVERVLGLPPVEAPVGDAPPLEAPPGGAPAPPGSLGARERGLLAHAAFEQLDFRRPLEPSASALAHLAAGLGLAAPGEAEVEAMGELVRRFAATDVCGRLARATQIRREQRFAFPLPEGVMVTGALDVLARERAGMLVVDYKTDALRDQAPAAIVAERYATQQLLYALAVLRSGAARLDVAHVFLERPEAPVLRSFTATDASALEAELRTLAGPLLDGRFEVAAEPHRGLCRGCPAEGGLCRWPLELTRRARIDQLF